MSTPEQKVDLVFDMDEDFSIQATTTNHTPVMKQNVVGSSKTMEDITQQSNVDDMGIYSQSAPSKLLSSSYLAPVIIYSKDVIDDKSNNSSSNETVTPDHHNSLHFAAQHAVETTNTITSGWDYLHTKSNVHDYITKRVPFIYTMMRRNASCLKISNLSHLTRFKDIQAYFFSPSVVFIRYIRAFQCAYIMYRSYKDMAQAILKHDKSVLCGKMIVCKAANDGELEYDNTLYSMMLSNQYASGLCVEKMYVHDTFIPEQHGIIQQNNRNPMNTNKSERFPKKKKDILKGLSQYYNTTNSTGSYKAHSHVLNTVILRYPIKTPIPFYILMKPWSKIDVDYSKNHGYWSINFSHAMALNYLFYHSSVVYFIFKITRTANTYSGYCTMESEFMDLERFKGSQEGVLQDTPFYKWKSNVRSESNRLWRCVCKVNWKSRRIVKSTEIGAYKNPWNKNITIAGSKDCTVIKTELGKSIVDEITRC